jgi:2-dehydropantoate 2-reductase
MWMKFALLAPMAGMTALTRGPIGPVRANAQSLALLRSAVDEVIALGMALKTGLTIEDAGRIMKTIDGLPKQMMASMAHDLLAGKPIELDGLSGAVARLGKQQGVPVPTHTFIVQALAPFTDGKPQV